MAERNDLLMCPKCGLRKRGEGYPLCSACNLEWDRLFAKSVEAALSGRFDDVLPYENIFEYAQAVGLLTLKTKKQELADLADQLPGEKRRIGDDAVLTVAKLFRGREGKIPLAVREAAVKKTVEKLSFESDIIRRHYGIGKAVESLETCLNWLKNQVVAKKRATAAA